MASINEKLDYINETKSLIKDKLNDLGSEITNQTTFREYAEKIEDLYEEWPKTLSTNTNITLNNTKKGKMNIELKGNTSQFTTTGKNLLDINNLTTNNVIQQISGSTLTLTGTGTGKWAKAQKTLTLKANTSYTLMGWVKGTNGYNAGFLVANSNQSYQQMKFNSFGQRVYLTLNFDTSVSTELSIQLFSNWSGTTANTTTVFEKVMLVEGTYTTEQDYEPYTGGIASPNPDYPQDIEIVTGENTINITNYNLLDFSGVSQESKVTVNDNGTVTLNGIGGFSLNFKEIDIVQGTTYSTFVELISGTITGSPMNGTGLMSPLGKGNWLSNNIQDIYTPNENKKRHSIWVGDQGTYNNATFRIWTYVGNTILPFQPYQIQMCPINLGTLELCKINDFQDYLYKQNNTWFKKPIILKINNYNEETITTDYISTTGSLTSGATVYYINPDSNPNGILITDNTLINQLNTLEQIYSYNNQTNISQINNDLPFILTASALLKNSN